MTEQDRDQTSESPPERYFRVARFRREAASLRSYNQLEDLFFREECELSAYRFLWEQSWHVAALGIEPPPKLQDRIESILSVGQPTSLPQELLAELQRRRAQSTRLGPWVERHVRSVPPKE